MQDATKPYYLQLFYDFILFEGITASLHTMAEQKL